MYQPATFEAALAAALGERAAWHVGINPVATTPWLPVFRGARAGACLAAARPAPAPATRTGTAAPAEARPDASLAAFASRGAKLGTAFTTRDLRRAYRTLARALHPDRHPHLAAADHARLAEEFAEVSGHYRRLSRLAIDARSGVNASGRASVPAYS